MYLCPGRRKMEGRVFPEFPLVFPGLDMVQNVVLGIGLQEPVRHKRREYRLIIIMEEGFQANRFVQDAGNINAVRKVKQLGNVPVVIVDGYWVILRIALMVVEDYIRIFLQRGEGSEKKVAGNGMLHGVVQVKAQHGVDFFFFVSPKIME